MLFSQKWTKWKSGKNWEACFVLTCAMKSLKAIYSRTTA
ncbi:hypothetical protein T4D_11511 [Trichinella pseudospiralis]|uniref:Uncharacterized protein n=1 Tax=Trichinella pseudospiralis TaxID=6337 RepID=A0A0V1DS91_TRIPS|nr:hypothetical protein T4D_11511 [Trichinella pseudospiralis]